MKISFGQIIHVDYTFVAVPGAGSSNRQNFEKINQIRREELEPAADKIWGPDNYTMDTFTKAVSSKPSWPPFMHTRTVEIRTGADMLAQKFKEAIGIGPKEDNNTGLSIVDKDNNRQPDYVFNID